MTGSDVKACARLRLPLVNMSGMMASLVGFTTKMILTSAESPLSTPYIRMLQVRKIQRNR